jgi:hypothetical protein
MHATAVEKITPQAKDPFETQRRILPPAISFLLRWGFFALIAIALVCRLSWVWCKSGYGCGNSTT